MARNDGGRWGCDARGDGAGGSAREAELRRRM